MTSKGIKIAQGATANWMRFLLIVCILAIPGSVALVAQSRPGARTGPINAGSAASPMIRGKIIDELTKSSLGNVQVRLEDRSGRILDRDFTDREGRFQFLNLGEESYVIQIEHEGFEAFRRLYTILPGTRGNSNEMIFLRRLSGAPPPLALANVATDPNVPLKALKAYQKGLKELDEKKRPERAVPEFEKAIELYPEFQLAYVQLGAAYIAQEQFEPARDALVKAVELDPEHGQAQALLGSAYQALGDTERMVGALQEAVRLNPDNFGAHAVLATVFLAAGNIEAASAHAVAAHDLNKTDPAIHLLMFNVAASANDMVTAEAELREFLELFPDHSAAPQIRERLEQIEQTKAPQNQ